MSKCKTIKEKLVAEIKQLSASLNLDDLNNLVNIAETIPCRKPSVYNIHIAECMKKKGSTMKKCAISWKKEKGKSELLQLEKKEKRILSLDALPKNLTSPKFTSFVSNKGLSKDARSDLWKQYTGIQEVPIEVSGEDIQAKASYHPQSDTSSIAVVDEDPEKIQIIAQTIPSKIEKVLVEEIPSSGITIIKIEGNEEVTTVISDLPLYVKKDGGGLIK